MFAYCNNNPVNACDKNGKAPDTLAGWIGEEIGKFIYELITGEDHPSRETERTEAETTQKQNEMIQAGVKVLWDAYNSSIQRENDMQYRQAVLTNNFVADRFSTNQKSANTLNFIGSEIVFGYSVSQICVAVTTGTAVGGPIIAAIGAGIILLGAMFSILAEGD